MAECRSCGKEIPEGTLYCNECEARMKADESYLDSLLSSVVANSAELTQDRPVGKTTAEPVTPSFVLREEAVEETDEFATDDIIEELFEQEENVEEFFEQEENREEFFEQEENVEEFFEQEESREEFFEQEENVEEFFEQEESIEESFGQETEEDIPEENSLEVTDEAYYNIFQETDDTFLDDLFPKEETEASIYASNSEEELLNDLLNSVGASEKYEIDLDGIHEDAAAYPETGFDEDMALLPDVEETSEEDTIPETGDVFEHASESENSMFGSYDDELDAEAVLMGEALAEEVFAFDDEPAEMPSIDENIESGEDDDPFAMFGMSEELSDIPDIPVQTEDDDMMDIWNMISSGEEQSSVVEETLDPFGEIPELFGSDGEYMGIPEVASADSEQAETEEIPKKKKKKNIFARIFGNIREELTDEEIEERKRLALEKFEEDEKKAADDAAQEKLDKEQRAKRKEEEAAQKQAEKEQLARKKADEKLVKAEQKRIKKDKKEQAKRALLAEIEENEGKINKIGASIIFVMFAAILCFIAFGTSYYNYKISIDKAKFDFDLQRYDDAYNDVYGLQIKEEDMELYDKIMTVQYVNIQLLSYMRYHSLDMDAEALDSLIKGLRRYEKFIQHGTELGVKEDLNYLKTQIVEQLDAVFGIDETTAYKMLALETQEEYSGQIYEIVSQKNN